MPLLLLGPFQGSVQLFSRQKVSFQCWSALTSAIDGSKCIAPTRLAYGQWNDSSVLPVVMSTCCCVVWGSRYTSSSPAISRYHLVVFLASLAWVATTCPGERHKQVRFISAKAERPNHQSRRGVASQGGGSHDHTNDNDNDDTYMTPLGRFDLPKNTLK